MKTAILSFIRNFKKQKLIYSITIGGFAISLAVLVLMVSFVIEEISVDKHLPHIKNMYRIKQSDQNARIPKRLHPAILNSAPEIVKLCLFLKSETVYEYNNKKEFLKAVSANPEFLDVFSIEILKGEKEGLLQSKTDLLITKSFAEKLFGDKHPIGEIIKFGNGEIKEVKAVIADPQKTSSLKYDAIFNLEQEMFKTTRGYNDETYFMQDAVFVLNANTDPVDVEKKIANLLKPFAGYEEIQLTVQPFREIYFDLKGGNDSYDHANINMIKLLSWIALIILFLAVLNYINLITALNNERYKEICIRKTSGARDKTIFNQLVRESYFSCFVSLILAIWIAIAISPIFKDLFNNEINIFEALKTPQILLAVILIFLIVGGITGVIPAFLASKHKPVELLQGKTILKNSNIRGTFNTVQLTVTLALIICLIVINKQIEYVKTRDVGFNKELLLDLGLRGNAYNKALIIKEKLLKYPNILNVSGSNGRPFGVYSWGSGTWNSNGVEYSIENLAHVNTDTSFLSTFGLDLIKGRNFRPTDKACCIINEKTYKHLQIKEIEGETIWGSEIVGVVKDFHFKKMHSALGFIQLKYNPDQINHLNIRISGHNIPQTLDQINKTLKEFEPGMTFNPIFYDDWINTMYQKEEKQAKAIKIYATIALLLSCLGLLGMAKYAAIKRTKEIGVHKVNGARITEIMLLLNSGYIKWVAIAFLLACPIAWYAMHRWLENFAYTTELNWWIFALAGLLALGIALLTVSWQSWRAARRNPVEALRYE